MTAVGTIASVWRYPVKSMAGETLDRAFVSYAGVYGDRLYAFRSSASVPGFPFLTAREQHAMLRHKARFRHAERAALPANLAKAEALEPGINPIPASPEDRVVEVETPTGAVHAVDDPAVVASLTASLGREHVLTLIRSDKAITDCRPLSLFSVQTAARLGAEIGAPMDPRRFRANLTLDFPGTDGFAEDAYVGRTLRLGPKATVRVLERDPRCALVTLDPDTAERDFRVLKTIQAAHDGYAGVYAAVLTEGVVRPGDAVVVED
ncbi:MAG: MOSC domain-containing protein [Alphaproteobacteria bacterium]|nr:MOSC domain-containing protein [Alphaproteobacteria bacterium]